MPATMPLGPAACSSAAGRPRAAERAVSSTTTPSATSACTPSATALRDRPVSTRRSARLTPPPARIAASSWSRDRRRRWEIGMRGRYTYRPLNGGNICPDGRLTCLIRGHRFRTGSQPSGRGAVMPRASHLVAAFAVAAIAGAAAPAAAAERLPYENPRLPTKQRVADLLSRMTLEEKVGQMTQTERYQVFDDETPITTYGLGSILSGGGSTPTTNDAGGVGRHGRPLPARRARHAARASRCSTASTPCTATATCSARPSSRTTSAWARRATRGWSRRSRTSPRSRRARAARSGRSRRASARRATTAGAAPTRASARTRAS